MRITFISMWVCCGWACALASPAAGGAERSVEMRYVAHVEAVPADVNILELWLPIPQDNAHQEITDFGVTCPFTYKITTEERYGNKTLYLQVENPPTEFDVELAFRVKRYENTAAFGRGQDEGLVEPALKSQKFVPLSKEVRVLAQKIVEGRNDATGKARAIYEHTLGHMTYDKNGTGWGRGDYRHACDVGRGNCTDFHSYFIALSRNVGVPAYFEIGVSLPPERGEGKTGGYHCWAYFWNGDEWIPVDISEADKHPEQAEYFFGNHEENRVAFTRGRDLLLEPPTKAGPLNFLIHPYAEVDGEAYENVSKVVFYKDLGR